MQIFEKVIYCPDGLCSIVRDPELIRISAVLDVLKKKGIPVDRFNLSSSPTEFVNRISIENYIDINGIDGLPVIIMDGRIEITRRYPTNNEFLELLDLPEDTLSDLQKPETSFCACIQGCC
jgi:hypothetical protein